MRIGENDPAVFDPRDCIWKVDVFPLQRSPSGKPRFLAKYENIACGSGWSVGYVAYDWDGMKELRMILHRDGVMPREDVDPAIWKFTTSGATITLPYCWHSAVDSRAAAHLCSIDSYDVTADDVRFIGTRTNYPDLEVIAKVIKYAQERDDLDVRAYCADSIAPQPSCDLCPHCTFLLRKA